MDIKQIVEKVLSEAQSKAQAPRMLTDRDLINIEFQAILGRNATEQEIGQIMEQIARGTVAIVVARSEAEKIKEKERSKAVPVDKDSALPFWDKYLIIQTEFFRIIGIMQTNGLVKEVLIRYAEDIQKPGDLRKYKGLSAAAHEVAFERLETYKIKFDHTIYEQIETGPHIKKRIERSLTQWEAGLYVKHSRDVKAIADASAELDKRNLAFGKICWYLQGDGKAIPAIIYDYKIEGERIKFSIGPINILWDINLPLAVSVTKEELFDSPSNAELVAKAKSITVLPNINDENINRLGGRAVDHNLSNSDAKRIIGAAKPENGGRGHEDVEKLNAIRSRLGEEKYKDFQRICELAGYALTDDNVKLIIVDTDDPDFKAHYGNVRMTGGPDVRVFVKKNLLGSKDIGFTLAHEFIEGQKLRELVRAKIQSGKSFLDTYVGLIQSGEMNVLEDKAHIWTVVQIIAEQLYPTELSESRRPTAETLIVPIVNVFRKQVGRGGTPEEIRAILSTRRTGGIFDVEKVTKIHLVNTARGELIKLVGSLGFSEAGMSKVNKALDLLFAKQMYQERKTGVIYVFHPMEVASNLIQTLSKNKASLSLIVSAILHDIVEDTDTTVEDVERDFGPDVARIIKGVTNVEPDKSYFTGMTEERKEIEKILYYQQHVLEAVQDENIFYIKIFDLETNALALGNLDNNPSLQARLANKYLELVKQFEKKARALGLTRKADQYREAIPKIEGYARNWRFYSEFNKVIVAQQIASIASVELGRTINAKDIETTLAKAKAGTEKVTLADILQNIRGDLTVEQVISIGDKISQLPSLQELLGKDALQNGGQVVLSVLEEIVKAMGGELEEGETREQAFRRVLKGLGVIDAESQSIFTLLSVELNKALESIPIDENMYDCIKEIAVTAGMTEDVLLRAYVKDYLEDQVGKLKLDEASLQNLSRYIKTKTTLSEKDLRVMLVNIAMKGTIDEQSKIAIERMLKSKGLWPKFEALLRIKDAIQNKTINREEQLDSPIFDVIMRVKAYKELKEGKSMAEVKGKLGNDKAVQALEENTEFAGNDVPEEGETPEIDKVKAGERQKGTAQVNRFSETQAVSEYYAKNTAGLPTTPHVISIPCQTVFPEIDKVKAGERQAVKYFAGLKAAVSANPNLRVVLQTPTEYKAVVEVLIKETGLEKQVFVGEEVKDGQQILSVRDNMVKNLNQYNLQKLANGNIVFFTLNADLDTKKISADIRNNEIKVFGIKMESLVPALILGSVAGTNPVFDGDKLSSQLEQVLRKLDPNNIDAILTQISQGNFFITVMVTTAELLKGYQLRHATVDIAA